MSETDLEKIIWIFGLKQLTPQVIYSYLVLVTTHL